MLGKMDKPTKCPTQKQTKRKKDSALAYGAYSALIAHLA